MTIRYDFLDGRSVKNFVPEFVPLVEKVFGSEASQNWIDGLEWRLINMPDLTVFSAYDGQDLVGFKVGYATAYNRYYSWLGGVHPDYRRRGIARCLMERQHDWLSPSRFAKLETLVASQNAAMIELNKTGGFSTTGQLKKNGELYLIMEKD